MKATPRRLRVAKRGADCEQIQSLLRLAHFIQVPIRNLGVKTCLKRGTVVWNMGEKRLIDREQTQTAGVWLFSNWRKRSHTKTHVHQTEIPERLQARTITHWPLHPPAPPLREGHHSSPNGLANSDPEPPLAPPPPSSEFSFLLVSFYFFFPLPFLPLFVCCFLSLFFFF